MTHDAECSSFMVAVVAAFWEVVEVLRWGVASNWFGLACPAHCSPSTFASLGFAFVLGAVFGFGTCLALLLILLRPCLSFFLGSSFASPHLARPSSLALERLRGYLHE